MWYYLENSRKFSKIVVLWREREQRVSVHIHIQLKLFLVLNHILEYCVVFAKFSVHTCRTREGLLWCAVRCLRLWPGQEFIPRAASGISEYGNKVLLSRPPRPSRPFTNYSLNMCAFMITMKTVVSLNRCWFYKRLFTRCVLLTAYTGWQWITGRLSVAIETVVL